MTTPYRVGERVDGLYDGNSDEMWYPGRVQNIHESADKVTFEVLYDDGEVESNVRVENLRNHVAGTICVGTRVLCHYAGGNDVYPGQIADVQENGRYTIAYDDGEVEQDVPIAHIVEPNEDTERGTGSEDEVGKPLEAVEERVDCDQATEQQERQACDIQDVATTAVESSQSVEACKKDTECEVFLPLDQTLHANDQIQETGDGTKGSTEHAFVQKSLELLETQLNDPDATKSILSTLVKQMRAYPQPTADAVNACNGERLLIDALKGHHAHAVVQCYGFVLLRRLCFLCGNSTAFFLHHGIVDLMIQAMNAFPDDAILQASACGALAVFTRTQAGLNSLIEYQVADFVVTTLLYHKTYSVHTRQVHYYGCEVLLELCELDDHQTLTMLCGEQEELRGESSPLSLLLCLLRQGLALDDKKTCCAVGSLLMCLAANDKQAAGLLLTLNGVAELSTVLTRYPSEPSIQKYSPGALKQIALCSVQEPPTKRNQETRTDVTTTFGNKSTSNCAIQRLPGTGKRKSNRISDNEASMALREAQASYRSSTAHTNPRGYRNDSSMYVHATGHDRDREHASSYSTHAGSAPQPPTRLMVLDGTTKRDATYTLKQLSKEDRQNELYEAYGVRKTSIKRPHGPKRSQHRRHRVAAEQTRTTSHLNSLNARAQTGRLNQVDPHKGMLSREKCWEDRDGEPPKVVAEVESQQVRNAKRKKQSSSGQTAFQVKVEKANQLRVSKDARTIDPSPQCLGVATKRAAKARQKRLSGSNPSSRSEGSKTARPSESLNDYAAHLFQENANYRGINVSRLTSREKEEIRERERLSFAEKLHKMIDRAKSTLTNATSVSAPVERTKTQPPKVSASSATNRRAQPVTSRLLDDQRLQNKKMHSVPSTTSKQRVGPSHRGTRAVKSTLLSTKRLGSLDNAASPPEVPRRKPTVSRPLKTLSECDPRAGTKATKATVVKQAEDEIGSLGKTSLVSNNNVPMDPEAHQVNDNKVDGEESAVELVDVAETISAVQVEPEVLISDEPVEVKTELKLCNDTVDESLESNIASSSEEKAGDGIDEELMDVEPLNANVIDKESMDVEPVNVNDDLLVLEQETADATVEIAIEVPSEDAQEARECPIEEVDVAPELREDQPSAVIDAMYGDALDEFDDIGDDEDLVELQADEVLTTVTSGLAELTLQESKSGGALYDDDIDEFDEDEADSSKKSIGDDGLDEADILNPIAEDQVDVVADDVAVIDQCLVHEEKVTVVTEQVLDDGVTLNDADTKQVAVVFEPVSGIDMDVVDTVTDAGTSLDHVAGTTGEGDDVDKYATEFGEKSEDGEVRTQAHDAIEDEEAGDQSHVFQEDPVLVDLLNEAVISTTEEAEAALLQPNEDSFTKESDVKVKAGEIEDEQATIIQSVVDEVDNSDKEEGIYEVKLNESIEVQSDTEKINEMTELDQTEGNDAEMTTAFADADREEEEPETLAAASSELGIQSVTVDQEDFDDRVREISAELEGNDEVVNELDPGVTTNGLENYDDDDFDGYEKGDGASIEVVEPILEMANKVGDHEEEDSQDGTGTSVLDDEPFDAVPQEGMHSEYTGEERKEGSSVESDTDVVKSPLSEGVSNVVAIETPDSAVVLGESLTLQPIDIESSESGIVQTDTELLCDEIDSLVIDIQPAARERDTIGNDADEEPAISDATVGAESVPNENASTWEDIGGSKDAGDVVVHAVAAELDTLEVVEVSPDPKVQELCANLVDEIAGTRLDADEAAIAKKLKSEASVGDLHDLLAEDDAVSLPEVKSMDDLEIDTAFEADFEQFVDQEDLITPNVYEAEQERTVVANTAETAPDCEDQSIEQDGLKDAALSEIESAPFAQDNDTYDNDQVEGTLTTVDTIAEAGDVAEAVASDTKDDSTSDSTEFDDAETETKAADDKSNELNSSSNATADNDISSTPTATSVVNDGIEVASREDTEPEAVEDMLVSAHVDENAIERLPSLTAVGSGEQLVDHLVAENHLDDINDDDKDVSEVKEDALASDTDSVSYKEDFTDGDFLKAIKSTSIEGATALIEDEAVDSDNIKVKAESLEVMPDDSSDANADDLAKPFDGSDAAKDEALAMHESHNDGLGNDVLDATVNTKDSSDLGVDCTTVQDDDVVEQSDSGVVRDHQDGRAANDESEASVETGVASGNLNGEVETDEAESNEAAIVEKVDSEAVEHISIESDVHSPEARALDSVEIKDEPEGTAISVNVEAVVTNSGDLSASDADVVSQDRLTEATCSSPSEEKANQSPREEESCEKTNDMLGDAVQKEDVVEASTDSLKDIHAVAIASEDSPDIAEVQEDGPLQSNAAAIVSDTSIVDAVHQDEEEPAPFSENTSIVTKNDNASEAVESLINATSALELSIDVGSVKVDASDDTPVGSSNYHEDTPAIQTENGREVTSRRSENDAVFEALEALDVKLESEDVAVFPVDVGETEDLYDDDEEYNDIEEVRASPRPEVLVSVPQSTEEEDEEYENDEYSKDDTTPRTDRAASSFTPPVSAREQEIEEVTEGLEDDAYADEEDDYHEDDDEVTRMVESALPTATTPLQADLSDDYDDDKEEFAHEELGATSLEAGAVQALKVHPGEEEIEDLDDYESDESYADSDE